LTGRDGAEAYGRRAGVDVPPVHDPVWRQVLVGGVRYQLDFFAAKILLGWLLLKVDNDPGEQMLAECVRTLHDLFAQNAHLPCVQHDLAEICRGAAAAGLPGAGGGGEEQPGAKDSGKAAAGEEDSGPEDSGPEDFGPADPGRVGPVPGTSGVGGGRPPRPIREGAE
jgi:hypothetical protein